jgi:hypothetical protein
MQQWADSEERWQRYDTLDRIELASFHLVEKLRVLENTIHTPVILGLGSLQDHDNPEKNVNGYVLIFH